MSKLCLFVAIFILGYATSVNCQWSSRQSYGGKMRGRTTLDPDGVASAVSATSKPPTKTVRSGGIGAWGYMAIILTVVLSGIGAYYGFILYPVVCKKQRMYDVMEMTTV